LKFDNEGQRISQKTGASAKLYISPNYDLTGSVIDKHIYAGDQLVATLRTQNGTTSSYYTHSDHLSGTSLVTDQNSVITELIDYYPYGDIRLDQKTSTYNESKKYIGQEYDEATGLSYMNARYQNGKTSRFLSQDPVFWEIGNEGEIKQKTGLGLQELLADPQQFNSYSYARNNPITYKDPTGNLTWGALLNHPIGSIQSATNWGLFSLGGNIMNKPFAASLLRHSASLNPSAELNIDSGNQKQYGNPVDQVMQTDQYKNYIKDTIQRAESGKMKNSTHFEFENRSDLYYALHGANIESQITQENGEWVVNSTVSDKYDFNKPNPQTEKGRVIKIPASNAYKAQSKGILSNYNVKIKISDRIKK